MHISGHTGRLFQLVTRVAKEHRSSLLAREIKRDGKMRHTIRIGKPISPASFSMLKDDAALSDYLRLCTMLLRYEKKEMKQETTERRMAPIDEPESPDVLEAEIAALPPKRSAMKTARQV